MINVQDIKEVLGLRRILMLLVLGVVSFGLSGFFYAYVYPERASKERELRIVKAQVLTLRNDIEDIRSELAQIKEEEARFSVIQDAGFFKEQGRYEVEAIFRALRNESGVISAIVGGRGAAVEENQKAEEANYTLLASPITVQISAMNDQEIYRYIALLRQKFPGHISVDGVQIRRQDLLDSEALKKIAEGSDLPIVQAVLDVTWRTMLPSSEVSLPRKER